MEFLPNHNLPPVLGEPNQLSRVVHNLISNALRYTEHGKVEVKINLQGEYVCLSVQDTGMGIENEDLPHLFERFYRGKYVRQSKIHGTGLGLAIVREIIDQHHGKIEVDSEVGKGSIFTVGLPILTKM